RRAPVVPVGRGLGAPARARHRLGAGRVRAPREPVRRASGGAGRGADRAAPLWDRYRDGRRLSAGVRRLGSDAAARGPGPRRARSRGPPGGRDGGWDAGGAVRAFGPGDPDRRLASPRRVENPGNRSREAGGGRREAGCAEAGEASDAGTPGRGRGASARTDGRCPEGGQSPSQARASPLSPPVPPGVLIPPIDLLHPAPPEDGDAGLAQIEQMGHKLIETLQTFRVEGSIAGRTVGPVVTQYEVAPGPGVKVGRIAALADDLALAMRAPSLRIVAPIPGKAAVGIEVPNPMPRMVHVRELIEGAEYHRPTRALAIALGKNLEGDPVVADLAKMPHLLIAGVTGSGKSVCINTVITSLIYTHPPEKLKLLMIDPKMVELTMYAALPHLGLPVVT